MALMDKFLNFMRLNDEEDDMYNDEEYLDDEEEVEVSPRKFTKQKPVKEEDEYEEKVPKKAVQPKVTPIRQATVRKTVVIFM